MALEDGFNGKYMSEPGKESSSAHPPVLFFLAQNAGDVYGKHGAHQLIIPRVNIIK